MKFKKVLLDPADGKKWLISNLDQDYTCTHGMVSKEDLQNKLGAVKTNTGRDLFLWDATFYDNFGKLKRGPAIIINKDIGAIMAHTLPNRNALIVDGGAGTGALACAMAHTFSTCKIVSYDVRENHLDIAKINAQNLDLENVEFKLGSLVDGIEEDNIDLMTVDMPTPHEVLPAVKQKLKLGCFMVCYLPCITQVETLVKAAEEMGCFYHDKTIEMSQRSWDVVGKKVRPKAQPIGHTAFLVFFRKVC